MPTPQKLGNLRRQEGCLQGGAERNARTWGRGEPAGCLSAKTFHKGEKRVRMQNFPRNMQITVKGRPWGLSRGPLMEFKRHLYSLEQRECSVPVDPAYHEGLFTFFHWVLHSLCLFYRIICKNDTCHLATLAFLSLFLFPPMWLLMPSFGFWDSSGQDFQVLWRPR